MLSAIFEKLSQLWLRFYEGEFGPRWLKPFRGNPCDVDAAPSLKLLGSALAILGSHCKCCSGTRVLLALALGVLFPPVAKGVLAGWVVTVVIAYVLQFVLERNDG